MYRQYDDFDDFDFANSAVVSRILREQLREEQRHALRRLHGPRDRDWDDDYDDGDYDDYDDYDEDEFDDYASARSED